MSEPEIIASLHNETARIGWVELQRFFAQGKVLQVSDELDLVSIARLFAVDDSRAIKGYLKNEKIRRVSDQQAREWLSSKASVWSVVVAPFVLVQNVDRERASDANQ